MNVLARRTVVAIPLSLMFALLLIAPWGSAKPAAVLAQASTGTPIDWGVVDNAMGKAGAMQPGNVYRYTFPRTDLQVTTQGVALKPAFALGGHVEMMQVGDNDAMFMGDLVLTQDEVSPVLLKLQQGGIDLAALHNHLLGETPRIMYLHVSGHGDPVQTAGALHDALSLSKTPFTAPAATAMGDVGLDMTQLNQILGYSGKANGAVYQFSIPRAEKIVDSVMSTGQMGNMNPSAMEIPPAMGVTTAINFQATDTGRAAITGDFVLLGSEVGPVSEALRANGIDVTAVHSHGLTETPRLIYLHFFANDDPAKLATGLRAALDATNSAKPTA